MLFDRILPNAAPGGLVLLDVGGYAWSSGCALYGGLAEDRPHPDTQLCM